ncbi:MAG: class I SAM-dependent methyltransferase [Deltaproteobacteria bacterium]|nr:class I SAM-dependent methyltransferase [Deltaproteobacteria bacterium]
MPSSPFAAGPAPGERTADPSPCVLCGEIRRDTLFHKQGYDFVRCASCSLVRLDPVPDEATLREVYERSYEDGLYAVFANASDVRSATADARVAAVAPHAPEGPWLEVGCSAGAFLEAAGRAGVDIDGFDLSQVAVDAAQRRGLSAVQATAESFVPQRRYACVVAFDVLEHLIDPNSLLERAHDWIAPGGRIALTVPDIKSPQARLMRRHWYYYAPPVHISYFDRGTVTRLLERHRYWPISISSAPKVMTIDYALTQLEAFNPLVHRAAALLGRALPERWRQSALHIPTGEILVVASA